MNPFNGMGDLVKNPLGILAIFLGVIYGIAALLLGVGGQSLTDQDRHLLTWLIVIFPFVALGLFGWLVACHHTKLYGPRDYRSDRSFLDSIGSVTPEERRMKLDREADALQIEPPSEDQSGGVTPKSKQETVAPQPKVIESSDDRRAKVRAAEERVLNQLSEEFTVLKRGAKLASKAGKDLIFDALGYRDGSLTIIEIIAIKYASSIPIRAKEVALQFASIAPTFPEEISISYLLCVSWTDGRPSGAERRFREVRTVFENVGLKNVQIRDYVDSDDKH